MRLSRFTFADIRCELTMPCDEHVYLTSRINLNQILQIIGPTGPKQIITVFDLISGLFAYAILGKPSSNPPELFIFIFFYFWVL